VIGLNFLLELELVKFIFGTNFSFVSRTIRLRAASQNWIFHENRDFETKVSPKQPHLKISLGRLEMAENKGRLWSENEGYNGW
jgi:hypothetical protein